MNHAFIFPETTRHLPLSWEIQPVAFIAVGWYIAPEGVPGLRGSNRWPSNINFNQKGTALFREEAGCSRFPLQSLDKVEKKVIGHENNSHCQKKTDFLQVKCCDLYAL